MPGDELKDVVLRAVAVIGLAGVALIHLLDAHNTFTSTPYVGWLYVGLITGSLGSAAWLLRGSDSRAWAAAVLLSIGAIGGFVWSRTVGLPGSTDDIGNWWESLGLASLFVEGAVATLGTAVLIRRTAVRPVRLEVSTP